VLSQNLIVAAGATPFRSLPVPAHDFRPSNIFDAPPPLVWTGLARSVLFHRVSSVSVKFREKVSSHIVKRSSVTKQSTKLNRAKSGELHPRYSSRKQFDNNAV